MDDRPITELLEADRTGESAARDRLFALVYQDLRRQARRALGAQSQGRTLTTTSVVHEAYLRMVQQTHGAWHDRGHFFAVAATAMRQVIVDGARKRTALKRGGNTPAETLHEDRLAAESRPEEFLALDELLDKLAGVEPRLVRVVECRYFAGLTEEETAQAIGVSVSTVQRDWRHARGWLRTAMEG